MDQQPTRRLIGTFIFLLGLLSGCLGPRKHWSESFKDPVPKPTLAETDEAFKKPLRVQTKDTPPPEPHSKNSWWNPARYLDDRTSQIEHNLGL